MTFLFDTGASAVVLTAADARKAGVDLKRPRVRRARHHRQWLGARGGGRLDQIAVGPIVMRDVAALVARPGALEESLLGMSFLERLKSYTVERGRLILTAK